MMINARTLSLPAIFLALVVSGLHDSLLFGGPVREVEAVARFLGDHPSSGWRFFSTYAVPEDRRQSVKQALIWSIHTLQHERGKIDFVEVSDTLVAFDLFAALSRDPDRLKVWLKSFEAIGRRDHVWHHETTVDFKGKKKNVVLPADWVTGEAFALAQEITGTDYFLFRAEHFIADSMRARDGGQYYVLAGVPPTKAEWFDLLGIDRELASKDVMAANISIRGPTRKPGRILFHQAERPVWFTADVITPDGNDPLRIPLNFKGLRLSIDGEEHLALINLSLIGVLFDGQGRRVDAAPAELAADRLSEDGSFILEPGISCYRCHRNSILEFQDETFPPDAGLFSNFVSVLETAKAVYGEQELLHVQRLHHNSLLDHRSRRVCGLPAEEAAAAVAWSFSFYRDRFIRRDQAARELGSDEDTIVQAFLHSTDPILINIRGDRAVLRTQFAKSFAEGMRLIGDYREARNL